MSQRGFAKLYPHDYVMKYTFVPLVPRFVQPNHITLFRMVLTPFVVWILVLGDYRLGIPLFILAAFTDVLDGSVARIRRQITPWGIFFDPIADKLLVGSVALTVALKYFHPILVFVAIGLDLLPAMVFLSRKNPGNQMMTANVWGKAKMFMQFVALTMLLIGIFYGSDTWIVGGEFVLGASLLFAIIAAVTYSL